MKQHLHYGEKLFLNHKMKKNELKSKHKDLIFTKANKGSQTVILDRVTYNNATEKLLSDKTTYITQNYNLCSKILL